MHPFRFCLLWLAIVAATGSTAPAQEQSPGKASPPDTIGGWVDRAIQEAREESRDLAVRLRAGFEQARELVDQMGVEARVYARLHWDKALASASLSISVENDVATLSGTVPSEEARAKALALATDTVGVERVVDKLAVARPGP